MAYMEKHESGAIVFRLTPEEQEVKGLKDELTMMKQELQEELERVKNIK